jgi:rhomboid-related protein 1/2/3
MIECIAIKILPHHRDRKYYTDTFKCWPPPYFIMIISIVEIVCFVYHFITNQSNSSVPIDSIFIYRPDKKHEIWRFLLYMLLHAGWFHLTFNLIVQILIGFPLEMVHGSGRIACIYLSGVIAGSLGTSIFDSNAYLVGSSGGVYALLAAHLANIMLNYSNMEYGFYRLLAILLFGEFLKNILRKKSFKFTLIFPASCDVGFAIFSRYESEPFSTLPSVSFVSHITGAVAGLTIGLIVLKNFEQKLHEQMLWWIALGIYLACIIFAIIFNIVNSNSHDFLSDNSDSPVIILKEHQNF